MVSVIIVACSLFLFMCLFVLGSCLLNAFAICVAEVIVLSVRVIVMRYVVLWLVCLCY